MRLLSQPARSPESATDRGIKLISPIRVRAVKWFHIFANGASPEPLRQRFFARIRNRQASPDAYIYAIQVRADAIGHEENGEERAI